MIGHDKHGREIVRRVTSVLDEDGQPEEIVTDEIVVPVEPRRIAYTGGGRVYYHEPDVSPAHLGPRGDARTRMAVMLMRDGWTDADVVEKPHFTDWVDAQIQGRRCRVRSLLCTVDAGFVPATGGG